MLPYRSFISWQIGPMTIHSFGLMLALAFLASIWLIIKRAKKQGYDENIFYKGIFIVWLSGLLGARIAHILEYPQGYSSILSYFSFWSGGISFIGALFGGILAGVIYLRYNKISIMKAGDIASPAIVLAHAIGRIGCILGDGGHVGKLTDMPWGFLVDGEVRHVTAWYSLIFLIALFIFLLYMDKHKKFDGFIFMLYLIFYSIGRFIIDLFRSDPTYFGLTLTQLLLIPVFIVSLLIFIKGYSNEKQVHKQNNS